MKPGTMLVNVSRGGLVDTDSVFEGLENGQLGSVGLDVYEDEGEGRAVYEDEGEGRAVYEDESEGRAVYEDEGEGRAARERFKVDESPEQLFWWMPEHLIGKRFQVSEGINLSENQGCDQRSENHDW